MDLPASLRFPKNRTPPGWAGFCFWRRVQDSTCSAEQAGSRLWSAPGTPFTTAPVRILLFFEKKLPARMGGELLLAEGAGFEPAWAFALTVFKTAPL